MRERLKLLILDALGCALYGAELEWCRMLRVMLAGVDSTAACAVWGTAEHLSAPHAALANGTQVQSFELDDVHRAGVLHVGAVVLPALVAIAELRPQMSGRGVPRRRRGRLRRSVRASACAWDRSTSARAGIRAPPSASLPPRAARGARRCELSAEKTVHALGIAGTQAAGLMAAQYGAMVKRMHAGRASQSGLYGALLAEQGFTGIENVFESEYGGFCTTFSRSQGPLRLGQLTAGLGATGRRWASR